MKLTNPGDAVALLMCLLFVLVSRTTLGQLIQGSVLDPTSQQPIPFVTIYLPAAGTGTLSNENGDFELPAETLPARLVISHINFQTDTITFTEPTTNYVVRLKPATHELAAVTVSNAGYKLIQQAVERVKVNTDILFGKAFYRQLTKNGDQPTELQEVMYNVKLSANKIEGVQISNARYARLPSDDKKLYFQFTNFSYLVLGQKAVSGVKPSASTVLLPLRSDAVDFYDIRVTNFLTQSDGGKVAELDCQVREGYTNPAFSGKVFINTTTHDLIKLQGTIHHSLGAAVNTDKVQTKNYIYSIDIDYANRANGSYFNTIRVTVELDQLNKATGASRKNQVSAFLLMSSLSDGVSTAKLKPIDIHREDLKLIQRAKYDAEFWRTNPVVRRTPLEESTIKAFEQQGVMGNMTFDDF